MCVCMCISVCVCLCVYVCVFVCVYLCVSVYVYVYVYECFLHINLFVRVVHTFPAYVWVYVWTSDVCPFMYVAGPRLPFPLCWSFSVSCPLNGQWQWQPLILTFVSLNAVSWVVGAYNANNTRNPELSLFFFSFLQKCQIKQLILHVNNRGCYR